MRQTWEHITRQHKIMACPYKQKHMASDHIHVRIKFSNKSINHTVETSFIHTNTKTHHICLTYILLKIQHSHNKKKKKCKLINFFICRLIFLFIFFPFMYSCILIYIYIYIFYNVY